MLLKIKVYCPLCEGEVEWIYDAVEHQRHRGIQGCPGGCSSIHDIDVEEIAKDRAQEFLDKQIFPENNLDHLTNEDNTEH